MAFTSMLQAIAPHQLLGRVLTFTNVLDCAQSTDPR